MADIPLTILLIDDDEDAYVTTRHLLAHLPGWRVRLDWVPTYEQGLRAIRQQAHDLYLIDYRLDTRDGLDLLREATAQGCRAPMIMLTGLRDHDVDVQAMEIGAADYLVKDRLDATLLERSIRYSLERQRFREQLEEKARRLRMLAGQLSQAEQRERSRVAQLLQDHLQQILVSARMHVDSMTRDNFHQQQRTAQDLLGQVLEVSRTLTVELSPPILIDAGLAAALAWLGRWMREKYNLRVVTDIDPEAEPASEPVRLMLFHAVRELLFNVSKHAQVGEARLAMSRENSQVRIDVEDKGVGFDPQILTRDPTSRNGSGLVHLRERITLVGGTLQVKTGKEQGCCVTLLAPRRTAESPAQANRPWPNRSQEHAPAAPGTGLAAASTRRIRVLVVDDHQVVRDGLARTLADQPDIEVVGAAGDGLEAIELTRQLKPDVVIMDVVMPRLNGFDATLRITHELPDVRVIGLSMYSDDDMAQVMRKAGATAYVSKGGPLETLLEYIRAPRQAVSRA